MIQRLMKRMKEDLKEGGQFYQGWGKAKPIFSKEGRERKKVYVWFGYRENLNVKKQTLKSLCKLM